MRIHDCKYNVRRRPKHFKERPYNNFAQAPWSWFLTCVNLTMKKKKSK